jgi:outer membrane biosynthesis protein TonB
MTHPRNARAGRAVVLVAIAALVSVVVYGQVTPTTGESTRAAPAPQSPLVEETPVPKITAPPSPAAETTPEPTRAPPPAPGVRTSTEVEAAAPVADPTPDGPQPASLLPGGVPDSASQLGKLVDGFPAAVPLADDSTVVSSSVDSNGGTVHATVVARTSRSADDVVALYETAFAALGLAASTVPSASGDRAVSFSRDGSSVTLTVTGSDSDSATTYSLFAVITPTP